MADKKLFTMLFSVEEKKKAKSMAKKQRRSLANLIKIKLFEDVK